MSAHLTYLEASVVGLVQGVTELFPVSSLGHNVLIPALIGGSWASDLSVAKAESPYLAFIVGLHVATAIALLIYFWRDWIRIITGFLTSVRDRQVRTTEQKLAWMVILATIPVGLVGLGFEHEFRILFGKPIRAAIFLVINGVILFAGEKFRTRKSLRADRELAEAREREEAPAERGGVAHSEESARGGGPAYRGGAAHSEETAHSDGTARSGQDTAARAAGHGHAAPAAARGGGSHASGQRAARQQELTRAVQADERLATAGFLQALVIGSAQVLALLAGISRDGVTMVAGMARGLSREDAARFAFLLATPVILAAGVLKYNDLIQKGHGIYGPILVGSILSGLGAYVSVRYLVKYFQTRTLTPFAIYCVLFGVASIIYLSVK